MTTPDEYVLQALHPRIALCFDFDETLAPGTTDVLLRHLGQDPQAFRRDHIEPLVEQGWEQLLARAHALRELSLRRDEGPITDETFAAVADELDLYPGVPQMFDLVREAVAEVDDDVDVEFHLITAGFVHVPSHTRIAHEFDSIRGGQWSFDDDGGILTPRTTLGHYDKVRHLLSLTKGLGGIEEASSRDPHTHVPDHDWHVPFEQVIFVGDGDSDLPAFDLMESRGGTGIAVRQADDVEEWESRDDMREGREVVAVARSDYEQGSPLMDVLLEAARRAAMRVRMLRAGRRDH